MIVYDLKTKQTEIVENPNVDIIEEPMETIPQIPTAEERIEALEMAMVEMLEVLANG